MLTSFECLVLPVLRQRCLPYLHGRIGRNKAITQLAVTTNQRRPRAQARERQNDLVVARTWISCCLEVAAGGGQTAFSVRRFAFRAAQAFELDQHAESSQASWWDVW